MAERSNSRLLNPDILTDQQSGCESEVQVHPRLNIPESWYHSTYPGFRVPGIGPFCRDPVSGTPLLRAQIRVHPPILKAAQDCTATAESRLVKTQVQNANAQLQKRKWNLVRPFSTCKSPGIMFWMKNRTLYHGMTVEAVESRRQVRKIWLVTRSTIRAMIVRPMVHGYRMSEANGTVLLRVANQFMRKDRGCCRIG